MGDALKDWELEALVDAPIWVYTAVATAGDRPNPSQYRQFRELLDVPDAGVEHSAAGSAALATLRSTFEARFAAFLERGGEPRKELERTRGILKRLPDDEREAITRWLVEVAIRVAESTRTLGEPAISDPEVRAIRDVAKWLDAPKPDLGPR